MNRRTITLTREDVQQILHYAHWIAAKNGEQNRFLQKNYPGWSMAMLMKALIDAKCLVKARGHFSGYQVRATLTTVHIQHDSIS
jgi:uncharacterized protein (DUF433 family)